MQLNFGEWLCRSIWQMSHHLCVRFDQLQPQTFHLLMILFFLNWWNSNYSSDNFSYTFHVTSEWRSSRWKHRCRFRVKVLSGTVSIWRKRKWAQDVQCLWVNNWLIFKNISTENGTCAPVKILILHSYI